MLKGGRDDEAIRDHIDSSRELPDAVRARVFPRKARPGVQLSHPRRIHGDSSDKREVHKLRQDSVVWEAGMNMLRADSAGAYSVRT